MSPNRAGWRPPAGAVLGILGSARREGLRAIWPDLRDGLAEAGFSFHLSSSLLERGGFSPSELGAGHRGALPEAELASAMPDLLLSLGGDGSLLGAVALVGGSIPLMGLHMGSMGYLTTTTPDHLRESLRELAAGQLHEERRMMLRVSVERAGGGEPVLVADALNDVAVSSGMPGRVVRLVTHLDDEILFQVTGDGLIHATPTGSTAYNLGGGGPILDPTMEAIVLTPVMPHSISVRPIVLEPGARVETRVRSRHGLMALSVDGRLNLNLEEGAVVRVERSPVAARLLKRRQPGFVGVLRDKLKWNQEDDA